MTMKIWRQVAGSRYTVVGHDGPRPLDDNELNTFPASVPVKPGDVLGLHTGSTGDLVSCVSAMTPGDSLLNRLGDAVDGESPLFSTTVTRHLNIAANFLPSNSLTLGAITRNKKKGTATITVSVPNEGELAASGKGVTANLLGPPNRLLIRARGKKQKTLNQTGKVKLTVAVTYTPTGGDPNTQSVKVKLKKKL
jgi:hypothetical protein